MTAAQTTANPCFDFAVLWKRRAADPWRLPWLRSDSLARWGVATLVVASLYGGLGAVVGRFFGAHGLFPAPIWLPAGIACVASMVGGARLLPGIFLGSLAVNWGVFHSPPLIAAVISIGNAVGPWIGALATRVLRPASGLFTRFLGVLGFILGGVLLHAAITAGGGTFALMLQHPMSSHEAYRTFTAWWLCDSSGTFFFAPALLLWLGAEQTPRIIEHTGSFVDTLVLLATLAVAVLLFMVPGFGALVRPDAVFLLTVPLSWITLRVSLRAAYTLLTLICIIATIGTILCEGPFHGAGVSNPLQVVGLMTVLFAMDALTLIALTSERREAEARLAEACTTLQRAAMRADQLHREALTDPLTGVGNRRFFMLHAAKAMTRMATTARPFSLILLDLDHFKSVNDIGGHALGDATLHAVAQALIRLIRSEDIFARIGGEEFAIALPDTNATGALEIAERLREEILCAMPAGAAALPWPMSASFGVTARNADDNGVADLLLRADAALYRAKANGRNRVELAEAKVSHTA